MSDEPFELIQPVVGASDLLDILAEAAGPLTINELATRADVAPPRAWRHLATLTHLNLVEKTDDDEPLYSLGWRAVRYGQRALQQNSLVTAAFPVLKQLRDVSQHSVHLSRRVENRAIVWLAFESHTFPVVYLPAGSSIDLRGTSTGRTLLAFLDPGTRALLAPSEGEAYPSVRAAGAITDAELEGRLAAIRENGYELVDGPELLGVAAPVFGAGGEVMAAVTLLGWRHRVVEPVEQHLIPMLTEVTQNISSRLGYGSLD